MDIVTHLTANIPDNHPLLLANLNKAQTSPSALLNSTVRALDSSGPLGSKAPPFNYHRAIKSFGSWCYKAAMINAKGVARCNLRLYQRVSAGKKRARDFKTRSAWEDAKRSGLGDVCLWNTRPASPRNKRWLRGMERCRPSRVVMSKAAEFGDDLEEVTDRSPVLDLLLTVNPYMNGFDLTVLRFLYLQLTGNAYIHPIIDKRLGVPFQLWPMPSQHVRIIPDRETLIGGYAYGATTAEMRRFAPDEVGQWKLPNPADPYFYGMGNVEAIWTALNLHDAKRETDTALYMNRARPDYLLIVKSGASTESLDRFEQRVDSLLRGTRNAGKFLAIDGDVTAQPMNLPITEIGDPERVIEEIAAGFDVPVTKLLANHPNRANAESADGGWLRDAIVPLLTLDEEMLNAWYLPLWGEEAASDLVLAYENPIPADEKFEATRAVSFVNADILLADEVRKEEGYPTLAEAQEEFGTTHSATVEPGSITNAVQIVTEVAAGQLPRESGLAMLKILFPLSDEQAIEILGPAGNAPVSELPAAEPKPEPGTQGEPVPADKTTGKMLAAGYSLLDVKRMRGVA